MMWPNNQELDQFLHDLSNFYPNLHFTHKHSTSLTNFLDLTIYKNETDTETFQKPPTYTYTSTSHRPPTSCL